MKNRTQPVDYIMSVEMNEYKDWDKEIIDDKHPVYRSVETIRRKTFVALSQKEYDHYMRLPLWSEREKYITNKALDLHR